MFLNRSGYTFVLAFVLALLLADLLNIVAATGHKPQNAKDHHDAHLISGRQDRPGERQALNTTLDGFKLYGINELKKHELTYSCESALEKPIACNRVVRQWQRRGYRRSLYNDELTDAVCDPECGKSLQSYYNEVNDACTGQTINGAVPTLFAGRLWAGYNETCLRCEDDGRYCNDVINTFKHLNAIEKMSKSDLCSFCYVERRAMMQRTPYSMYNEHYKGQLEYIYSQCNASGPTDIPASPFVAAKPKPERFCVSDKKITTNKTETCDSISLKYKLSSAALFSANQPAIRDCRSIAQGTVLCLPPPCTDTYVLQPDDTCWTVHEKFFDQSRDLAFGSLLPAYNPWISHKCSNLQQGSDFYGRVVCLSPQNGRHNKEGPGSTTDTTVPQGSDGYTWNWNPPPQDCEVAEGTTTECGKWHEARSGDSCASIAISRRITSKLLLKANPSLGTFAQECDEKLVMGKTYCVQPQYGWDSRNKPEATKHSTTTSEGHHETAVPIPNSGSSSSGSGTVQIANGTSAPSPLASNSTDVFTGDATSGSSISVTAIVVTVLAFMAI